MNGLEQLKRNWEGLANADPLWAICTDPARKERKWKRDEFFATGRLELGTVMALLEGLAVKMDRGGSALDFGCGVGRLTRAMAQYFPECCGVDISPTMIRLAQQFNADLENCCFLENENPDLDKLGDRKFAFIYSSIVLQHIPSRLGTSYLRGLIRLLKPGGIFVFQLLDEFRGPALARLRQRVALRRRIRAMTPSHNGHLLMDLHCLRESSIRRLLNGTQAKLMDVRCTNSADPDFNGRLQYSKAAPTAGYVSKQYVVIKPQ